MACTVAVATSPSPAATISPARSPLSCKPEALSVLISPSCRACPTSPSPLARGAMAASASPSQVRARPPSGIKRKRALWIDVPEAVIGDAVTPVSWTREKEEVEEEGDGFGVYCRRGSRRLEMEDRHTATVRVAGEPNMAFFGVFDGHGGTRAAEFASQNLYTFIEEEMLSRSNDCSGDEEGVRAGYLRTDREFLKEEVGGGTCCVTALLRRGNFVISNLGDCRAVLSRAGKAEALTSDHRLSSMEERDRVERLGAFVDCSRGVWRLQGTLAVSRGIGDRYVKQWVIAEPESTTRRIEPDCEFLILASDGLWDKVSNQEAVDAARPMFLHKNAVTPLVACKRLVDLSRARGSQDDITVTIIDVQNFS